MNAWRELLVRVPDAEELFLPFAIDGRELSDFERLSVMCGLIPMCRGHMIAGHVSAVLNKISGVADAEEFAVPSAVDVWNAYNRSFAFEKNDDFSQNAEFESYKISVEKYNNYAIFDFDDALDLTCETYDSYFSLVEFVKSKAQRSVVKANVCAEQFVAPNRYIAEGVFNKIKKGEKYNNIDKNCLYSQLLCEIISDKKCKNNGIMIYVPGRAEYARDLVEYMHSYNMHARIFVGADITSDPKTLLQACNMSSAKGIITPVIFMSKNDNFVINKRYVLSFEAIYPSALIERVWTD